MFMNQNYNEFLQSTNKIQMERPNWPSYINRWVLLYSIYKGWIFGVLKAYDPTNGELKIQALINGSYQFITEYGVNITRGYVVDNWTQIV